MSKRLTVTEAREVGFYWVVLGQNPPEIAYWERSEWWLAGDPKPWQPHAVTAVSDRLVFKPRLATFRRKIHCREEGKRREVRHFRRAGWSTGETFLTGGLSKCNGAASLATFRHKNHVGRGVSGITSRVFVRRWSTVLTGPFGECNGTATWWREPIGRRSPGLC